jgi:hypothetical protein
MKCKLMNIKGWKYAYTKVDLAAHNNRGNHGRSQHQAPIQAFDGIGVDIDEGNAHDTSDHNTKRGPHLPHHDKCTTNSRGRTFGSVDGDGAGLGTNSETEEKPGDEQVPPVIGERLPETRSCTDEASDHDRISTTKPLVEGGGEPTKLLAWSMAHEAQGNSYQHPRVKQQR